MALVNNFTNNRFTVLAVMNRPYLVTRTMWSKSELFNYFNSIRNKLLPKLSNNNTPIRKLIQQQVESNKIINSVNQKELTISLLYMYESLFLPTPDNIMLTLEEKLYRLTLYKTYVYLKSDPYYNIMLHKKLMNVLISKEFTKTHKFEAFDYFMKWYKYQALKYNISINEKTNFTVLYEIYAGLAFGENQPSVHTVTFLSENVKRSVEAQNASVLQTKQKNCDLSVTYNSNGQNVNSLLDILIGKNKEYKGNLIFTKYHNIEAINEQKKHMSSELTKYINNPRLEEKDQQLIKYKLYLIESLQHSGMTQAAQIITLQEHIISIIPIIRKITPNYNPNMIVFIPENEPPSLKTLELAEKLKKHIPYDFGINTPNSITEDVIRKTLPVYLEYKRPQLSLMSPTERHYCLDIIKKYAPEYYATIST